ncbi:hypothetical protein ES707_14073 [subsurface metagenome]
MPASSAGSSRWRPFRTCLAEVCWESVHPTIELEYNNSMIAKFALVRNKLGEAKFFLDQMTLEQHNLERFNYYFSAFLSAARSVTWCMQESMKHVSGFDVWYLKKRQALNKSTLAKAFQGLRNAAIHTGDTGFRVEGIKLQMDAAGHLYIRNYLDYKHQEHDNTDKLDISAAANEYLQILGSTVLECEKEFPLDTNPEAYFTKAGLKHHGMTIEDLEEVLGYPRGWTKGIPDSKRLRMLKEHSSPREVAWIYESISRITRGDSK